MLNSLLAKKQYLRSSPLWQLYRQAKRNPIPIDYFAINSKLLSAYFINQYKNRSITKEYILKYFQNNQDLFKKNYNFSRLYALLGEQYPFFEHLTQHQQKYLQRLRSFSIAYHQLIQFPGSISYQEVDQKMIDYLNSFEAELKANSGDQLDNFIVCHLGHSQLKIAKLCKIRDFYWDYEDAKYLVKYTNQQFLRKRWSNIDLLSIVLARLSSSNASQQSPLLNDLDDLINSEQKVSSKQNFERNNFKSLQDFEAFTWQKIYLSQHLATLVKVLNLLGRSKQAVNSLDRLIRTMTNSNLTEKYNLLELVCFHSVSKSTEKIIKSQLQSPTANILQLIPQLNQAEHNSEELLKRIKRTVNRRQSTAFYTFFENKIDLENINRAFISNIYAQSPYLMTYSTKLIRSKLDDKPLYAFNKDEVSQIIQLCCITQNKQALRHCFNKLELSLQTFQDNSVNDFFYSQSLERDIRKYPDAFYRPHSMGQLVTVLEHFVPKANPSPLKIFNVNDLYNLVKILKYQNQSDIVEKIKQNNLIDSSALQTIDKLERDLDSSRYQIGNFDRKALNFRNLYWWSRLINPLKQDK